jgi:O-antigen/teichoic acid export membrane protein
MAPVIRAELAKLASHSAIYGAADFLPYLVNFFFLPIFTVYLSPLDYGALGILLLFGVLTKIFFRMGLDSGFFRIYYDLTEERERKILATTLLLAALCVSLTLFLACFLFRAPLARLLLGHEISAEQGSAWVVLVALDTLLNTFAFVPMNLFRIQDRPTAFSVMTILRSLLNIALKLALVLSGFGVSGVLAADVVASLLFTLGLSGTLVKNAALGFSWPMLRAAASFGLPKVPHGLAHQVLNLADRKLLEIFATLSAVGLYHVGYVMGTGVKFFLSAFELAWGPFVYAQLDKPDAPRTLARVVTYAFAALAGFGLLNAVFGREVLILMTDPEYHEAHPVIPVVVLAYVMQGVFALTSVGIGIRKKTRIFPVLTFSAASLNVLLNVLWIPRFGVLGAAWATVAGYALMAIWGARVGARLYPIPFEWARLGRVVVAGGLSFGLSTLAPPELGSALAVKAASTLAFPLTLYLSGFFRGSELSWLRKQVKPASS